MSRVLAILAVLVVVIGVGTPRAAEPEGGLLDRLAVASREPGVERVVTSPGGPITAAVRAADVLVTADAALRVWDPRTGAVLGEHELERPLTALAASGEVSSLAAVDDRGAIALWDVGDPARPQVHPLVADDGAPVIRLAFSETGTELLAVRSDGQVDRFESSSGARLEAWRLETPVTAAEVIGKWLYAATTAREILRFDGSSRETVVATAPGDITGLAGSEYGPLVAGTTAGLLRDEDGEISTEPGAVTAVASAESAEWVARADGVTSSESGLASRREASALVAGPGGPVALNRDGSVSLLADRIPDLELPRGPWTGAAAFGPAGDLLTTEGEDVTWVEALVRVRPGKDHAQRRYEPDPSWWRDDADGTWSVSDLALGTDIAVAGGQDPTGAGVVLVWDAASGRPLRRLAAPGDVVSVAILEQQKLLAAYSGNRVLLWSLGDFAPVATIDVGLGGGFAVSPDERTVAVAGSTLAFVDVDKRAIDHRAGGAAWRVAFSPDGKTLAAIDGDGVRFLTAGGRDEARAPVALGAMPLALAWRPDGGDETEDAHLATGAFNERPHRTQIDPTRHAEGRLLAIALEDRRTVLVDDDGRVSAALRPPWEKDAPVALSWSPDGRLLAVTNRAEDEEDGTAMMRPANLFRFDRLEARACALGVTPCPALAASPPVALPGDLAVASVDDGLFGKDAAGHAVRLADQVDGPFVWSASGALQWTGAGAVRRLAPGGGTPRAWPCACDGVALDGETPLAVTRDGSSLLRFGETPERVAITGLPAIGVRTLAHVGDATIVAGFRDAPERSTPNPLFAVAAGGAVTQLDDGSRGHAYGPVALAPGGHAAAFAIVASSGACSSRWSIGVIEDRRIAFPPLPGSTVRSLRYDADGRLFAVIEAEPCQDGAREYRLDGATWVPTNGDTAGSSTAGIWPSERPRSP